MRLDNFWTALDTTPNGEDIAINWKEALGEEWPVAKAFLKSRGEYGEGVRCPHPTGEGCPRKVTWQDDGSVIASCGDRLHTCKDLHLNKQDVVILSVHKRSLEDLMINLLSIRGRPHKQICSEFSHLGNHCLTAAKSFPVFLYIPGPWGSESIEGLDRLANYENPVLLTPTMESVVLSTDRYLNKLGVTRKALSELIIADDRNNLLLVEKPNVLFQPIYKALQSQKDGSTSGYLWELPAGAKWEEVTIKFISLEKVTVTFRGTTRAFEPRDFTMIDKRKGDKVNKQWGFFQKLAVNYGRVPVHPNPSKPGYQAQKQALSERLIACFGIKEEPIPDKKGSYCARFVINAEALSQGIQGQQKRKFVPEK